MATPRLEAVHRLHIFPLLTIHREVFREQYDYGLARSLYETREHRLHLNDLYLVDAFMRMQDTLHSFDGLNQKHLYAHLGLTLGEIHGGVLSSCGTIRPDISTLVTLRDEEVKRGYRAGREFYFTEADTEQEWQWTEDRLLEWFRELAQEYDTYQDAERTVRFCIGCILGELSGRLFPWTAQEQHIIEEESIRLLGYVCRINPRSLAAQQFSIQTAS